MASNFVDKAERRMIIACKACKAMFALQSIGAVATFSFLIIAYGVLANNYHCVNSICETTEIYMVLLPLEACITIYMVIGSILITCLAWIYFINEKNKIALYKSRIKETDKQEVNKP